MKKQAKNPLIGRMVIVHPNLTTDPIQRQGEIGKVTDISSFDKEVLTVEFKDGKRGAYFSNGLLTLFPKIVIKQGLLSNQFSDKNRRIITSVIKLVQKKSMEEALKTAMTNDISRAFCAVNCEDWLDMKKEQRRNIRKSKGV